MAKDFLMSYDEIAAIFRQAKNKREQVSILADLNLCSPFEIADLLEALGEFEGTELKTSMFSHQYSPIRAAPAKQGRPPRPQGTKPAPLPPIDERRAMELWAEGMDDIAMADSLGVSVKRVANWRLRCGLKRPRGGARMTKKEKPKMEALETMEPETVEAPAIESEGATAAEPERLLSAAEFLKVVSELLTPAAVQAELYLNGAPVHQVSAIHIKMRGAVPCVDIVTEDG